MVEPAYTPVGNQSAREREQVEEDIRLFMQARSRRYNFEAQWQESALIYFPEYANTFFFGYDQWPGQKKSQYQLDGYTPIALHRFGGICNSLITPWTDVWSRLKPGGKDADYLLKQKGVSTWFSRQSDTLWRERYKGHSGFLGAQLQNWMGLGAFGNQNMFVEELWAPHLGERGLSYSHCPVGQVYYLPNHQGVVDSFFRAFKWTAKQIYEKWPNSFPEELRAPLVQGSQQQYWVLHYVRPNTGYDASDRITARGKRWLSRYISFTGMRILEEGGYRTYPMPVGRYIMAPDEYYARGPAQMVLAAAKSRQAMKAAYLKQTHRAGDPVLLGPDGGLVNTDFVPGEFIEGGMTVDGKRLIDVLPTGKIEEIVEAMKMEQEPIDDAFLISLFQLALKTEDQPQLSVRQVMELLEQRAMLIGPAVGRQITEYLGSMVPREMDILSHLGKLDPVPGALAEFARVNGGCIEYEYDFDNALLRSIAAGQVAAFMQSIEMAAEISNSMGGNQEVFYPFALDRAIPDMSRKRGVPDSWMATAAEIAKKGKAAAQAQQREQEVKELPGRAAMAKAQAIVSKAQTGGNIGGTLSGTPQGGMPMVPGNPRGTPGRPGVGGRPGTPGRPGR